MNKVGKLILVTNFLCVLLVGLLSVSLLSGVIFDATELSVKANPETIVGGVMPSNTTWTLGNSPYIITETVQIPENVVLTIEPGVVVESALNSSDDFMFLFHGKIVAMGTVGNKIVFDGGCVATGFQNPEQSYGSSFFSTAGAISDTQLILDNCVIQNGNRFYWGTRGHLNLTNSELTKLGLTFWGYNGDSQIYYPGQDVYIQKNLFVNTTGFGIANLNADVFIRYNLFTENKGPLVWNTEGGGPSRTFINYNSFINVSETVLRLSTLGDSVTLDATDNYWETTNPSTIESLILDGNDDINIRGVIEYSSPLTEPHPDTPTLSIHTEVSGMITSDTTWTQAKSPYNLTGPTGISEGVTLTIAPGVTVNLGEYNIEINGTFRAQGTYSNKILFTSAAPQTKSDTPAIRFLPGSNSWDEVTGSGSIIENAVFDSVSVGISAVSPKISYNAFGGGYFDRNAISVNSGSAPLILNNTVDGAGSDTWGVGIGCGGDALIFGNTISNWITSGVKISAGSAIVEWNLIVNNTGSKETGGGGIRLDWSYATPTIRNNTVAYNRIGFNLIDGPWPVIVNNNVQNNSELNVYLHNHNAIEHPQHDVNVTDNWWGTNDTQTVNQSIFDFNDDFHLGTVNFVPFLTEPNPEAPIYTPPPEPETFSTEATISVDPNPASVNYPLIITGTVTPPLPDGYNYTGIEFRITDPDGYVSVIGPVTSLSNGTVHVNYTPNKFGEYEIGFRLEEQKIADDTYLQSNFASIEFRAELTPPEDDNLEPVASFTFSPEAPETNETVTFDASSSVDPDGSITDYFWDFGDGTTGTGVTTTHTYTSDGSFTVTLTVTDNEGLTDDTTKTITDIIPEFPSWIIAPVILIATLLIMVCNRKMSSNAKK